MNTLSPRPGSSHTAQGVAGGAQDVAPLTWVLDELRQAQSEAVATVQSFVDRNAQSRAGDLAEVDASDMRLARQHLHQAVGALELVDLRASAQVVRAMEAAMQRLVQRPDLAQEQTAQAFAKADRALGEYLERRARARLVHDLALYPAYRELQEIAGAERIHPADLWFFQPATVPEPPQGKVFQPGPQVRAQLDKWVLQVVKSLHPKAAELLGQIAGGLSRGAEGGSVRHFWLAAAAYFEAVAQGLLPDDVHVKRAASRILVQYTRLSQNDPQGLDLLLHDLLFLGQQAQPVEEDSAPHLATLRRAHGFDRITPWDYNAVVLGRYDPGQLAGLRACLSEAQRAWALWSEGGSRAKQALDSLVRLAEAMRAFHAPSASLADILVQVAAQAQQGLDGGTSQAEAPLSASVAMELATLLLFLDAAFDDFDPTDVSWDERLSALSDRLMRVVQGGAAPEPLPWMRLAYQRLSERQTLDHVVDQLQAELVQLETALDRFFRHPDQPLGLRGWPERLDAMRGVVALLDLGAADRTLGALRHRVSHWAEGASSHAPQEVQAATETVGGNLSTLGWLLDTLRRQPELARERFFFDESSGILRSLLVPGGENGQQVVSAPVAEAAVPTEPAPESGQEETAELLAIFLDEAGGVFAAVRPVLSDLNAQPEDLGKLTALRRAFHTLKGSARMVGLDDFGEAAWAMEQLLNAWLADQKPASSELLQLSSQALDELEGWSQALRDGSRPAPERSAPVRVSADALRLEGRFVPLGGAVSPEPAPYPDIGSPAESNGSEVESNRTGMDEAVKVIGPLRIDLELYNVFLNEADEWSRRLSTTLSEWVLQPAQTPAGSLTVLAHSLAGGAATVGYMGLATLARALEHALERLQAGLWAGHPVTQQEVSALHAAADDIRALLHQFAAGFLKEPTPAHLRALEQVALEHVPIDRLDADLFSVFEEEALELLPRLSAALRQWVARPENDSARAEFLRNLHTFKGSARLAGASRLGEMAHQLESDVLERSRPDTSDRSLALLQQGLDAVEARFELLRRVHAQPGRTDMAQLAEQGMVRQAPELDMGAGTAGLLAAPPEPVPAPTVSGVMPALPSVRVRPELLDQLMTHTADVMGSRIRLEAEMRSLRQSFKDMGANLGRLRLQLRELELQTESQVQSRLAQAKEVEGGFDPLEFDRYTRVQELTRLMSESVDDVATVQRYLQRAVEGAEDGLAAQARQTRELQRDLLRTRMVAFDVLAERLHRAVRQAAQARGCDAELVIEGGDIEVDRGVLDRLTPVLEHLLRNAVAHGIEPADLRLANGKPAQGTVRLSLAQTGNDLSLDLSDDGAGLDLARIRERAVTLGWLATDARMEEEDAARFIFSPGFSTASEVTELSGRGIGLDAVRSEVLGLGGRIAFYRPLSGGAGFRVVVPLSTAVTQVVMLRIGGFTFGVPAPWVENVHRASATELTAAYASGQWQEAGQGMPFFWPGALLALSAESDDPQSHQARNWPVLVFHSAGQRVAWHVDEVLGHQEVVVKPLGPQLSRLPGLAGATVLASGAVALIYNPVALSSLHGEASRDWVRRQRNGAEGGVHPVAHREAEVQAPRAPLVLVVDDSITVRRVTQRLLQREGYRVALAADGQQALERLQEEIPVVVLSDIEMPQMDGFELLRQLRADERWADLPVVMITSRTAEKHREHARALGVEHYLGKPYAEEVLLGLVAGFAGRAD